MNDTVFGKIIRGEIPAHIVYETEHVLAFRDIAPQAPTHIVVIPKQRVESLAHADDPQLLGQLLLACKEVAQREGLDEEGYRVVTNIGANGGQSVFHLHFHVLGGRELSWPPG